MQENETPGNGICAEYQRRMLAIRGAFEAGASGSATVAARAKAMDDLIVGLWTAAVEQSPELRSGVALVAIGGYGRAELFPYSDVDLLYLLDNKISDSDVKLPIRRISQELWDCGIRLSPQTRKRSEAEKFEADNVELALALMDHRLLAGDGKVYERFADIGLPKMLERESEAVAAGLAGLTSERHKKYGDTLFHLEPSIKDCPGGLRDVHVCAWMLALLNLAAKKDAGAAKVGGWAAGEQDEFAAAVEFLFVVRCFLHYRHERDDNTLDWQAQDLAAKKGIGLDRRQVRAEGEAPEIDAAYWMRFYFRYARSVERRLTQMLDVVPTKQRAGRWSVPGRSVFGKTRRQVESATVGFRVENGRAILNASGGPEGDPAQDPEVVLELFAAMARTGCVLDRGSEERMSQAIPLLSNNLEEGPGLWRHLRAILLGLHAGRTLRAMHALGILELLIPEFHGIDALVIRDAYHRYTVDEHTIVLIDTLHGMETPQTGLMAEWSAKFGEILREVQHQDLLYLGALMHDTGKGRNTDDHALESAVMAEGVAERLELDVYERELLLGVIRNHLEMSAALRRDIFDQQTIRAFAGKVQTPEALRMLTLFTYADINAVHPDALTPWKAENLWRLYLATASYLDRNVDDERVSSRGGKELVNRVVAVMPGKRAELEIFLEGFPERYLRTRTPEQVRMHFEMAERFSEDKVQIAFHYAAGTSDVTLVTPDRALLFSDMAGALAGWGMNIVTADGFSNTQGVVVDHFRFTDPFRTLEMNVSEHAAFVESLHEVMAGKMPVEKLLTGRRRGRRKTQKMDVTTRVDFDDVASTHSTLLQVVAQDKPGMLRAVSLALAAHECNIEVALVDTEGETAIDVFYVTHKGAKLDEAVCRRLKLDLIAGIEANAG
ncbi:MAG TPA: [protein-PII] uridylyltransferase [Acidobacteriaceae bacterium]|nr:[protein-PII] uridylyltransferase [Acidobacteriaceae bacterium]